MMKRRSQTRQSPRKIGKPTKRTVQSKEKRKTKNKGIRKGSTSLTHCVSQPVDNTKENKLADIKYDHVNHEPDSTDRSDSVATVLLVYDVDGTDEASGPITPPRSTGYSVLEDEFELQSPMLIDDLNNDLPGTCSLTQHTNEEELESQENELLQRKAIEQAVLLDSLRSGRPLREKLRDLHSSSMERRENLKYLLESITSTKAEMDELDQAIKHHQEDRNLKLSAAHEAHRSKFMAEKNLRELQVEKCELTLQLTYDPERDETMTQIIDSMTNKEENLLQEMSHKIAELHRRRKACADADSNHYDRVEKSRKLFHEWKNTKAQHQELNEVHAKNGLEIASLETLIRQNANDVMAHEYSISRFNLDLERITRIKAIKRVWTHEKDFIGQMDELLRKITAPMDGYPRLVPVETPKYSQE